MSSQSNTFTETSPLGDLRVLDLTTLLPGPLASHMLSKSGADVIKIERPPMGDDMRHLNATDTLFKLLNGGKRSVMADLKNASDVSDITNLIKTADILIEQFRPGVMARLGLGYDDLRKINPKLIYCSITGFGQTGPLSGVAGHDLNYLAESGLLSLGAMPEGNPVIPPTLIADIAGGSYPAVVNILLAVIERQKTGFGCHLDVAMTDNIAPFMLSALSAVHDYNKNPAPGGELLSGGSPRYQIYKCKDKKHLAVAALEEKFWNNFCQCIDLVNELRLESADPDDVINAITEIIAGQNSDHWQRLFSGKDVCCNIVSSVTEAINNPHFIERGTFQVYNDNAKEPGQLKPTELHKIKWKNY